MSTLEDRRQWAEDLAATVDPGLLVAQLCDAGWQPAAGRDGVYAVLVWPGSSDKIRISLDRTAPERGPLMAAALIELEWAAERGRAAQTILDRLADGHS